MTTSRNGRRERKFVLLLVGCMLAAMLSPFGQAGRAYALAFIGPVQLLPNDSRILTINGLLYTPFNGQFAVNAVTDGTIQCVDVALQPYTGGLIVAPIVQ